jgi:hypothetical protein
MNRHFLQRWVVYLDLETSFWDGTDLYPQDQQATRQRSKNSHFILVNLSTKHYEPDTIVIDRWKPTIMPWQDDFLFYGDVVEIATERSIKQSSA